MGDSPVGKLPPDPGNSQGNTTTTTNGASSSSSSSSSSSLSVITEGVGELALIDPEVAKKACQEVLEKVKQQQLQQGSEAVPNGQSCQIRCLDDPPGSGIREEEEEPSNPSSRTARKRQHQAKQSWLLRLFESKLFDISMAISYLYNSKEPGVQAYIGNRLFCFRHEDVDFYLPQLLNMYIHMDEDVGDAIKPYIVHRCRQSVDFSLRCALLLGAYSSDMHISTQRHSRGTKLRRLILSDELKPAGRRRELGGGGGGVGAVGPGVDTGLSPSKRTHQRSKSDATVSISLSSNLKRTASNPKVESEEEGQRDAWDELRAQNSHPKFQEFLDFPPFLLLSGFFFGRNRWKIGIIPHSLWNVLLEWEGFLWECWDEEWEEENSRRNGMKRKFPFGKRQQRGISPPEWQEEENSSLEWEEEFSLWNFPLERGEEENSPLEWQEEENSLWNFLLEWDEEEFSLWNGMKRKIPSGTG